MVDKAQVRTHLTRAGVGLALTGGTVAAVVLLGSFVIPEIQVAPVSVTVDTASNATRTLACPGSALETGVDPVRPLLGVPTGPTVLTLHDATGDAQTTLTFAREVEGETSNGSGIVLEMAGEQAYAEALSESQQPNTGSLRGLLTTQCTEATNETWIVGGTTTVGGVTLISLTNPGDVPATVTVNVFDAEGPVESLQSAGVVVPPKSQRTFSLNGAAPERASLAVQVQSRGAKVVAVMQESLVSGLTPRGVDTVSGIAKPSKSLAIPGIITPAAAGEGDAHEGAAHTLRVLAPGDTGGVIRVTGVDAAGNTVKLVTEYVKAGMVTEFPLEKLTAEYSTVVIDADVPVVASATGAVESAAGADIMWFTAAPVIDREIPLAVPDAPGAELTLYNPTDEVVLVDLVAGNGNTPEANITISVPARASIRQAVKANSGYQLLTGAPIYAALSFVGDGLISGFPIAPPLAAAETVQVFTR